MTNNFNKWASLRTHASSSVQGFLKELFLHPIFAFRLIKRRAEFFVSRKFKSPFITPDQFLIESASELVSYWSFFIEGESRTNEWEKALAKEPRPLVLDVGANAGLFSHLIWRLRPDVELVVFEPLPKMAEKIANWGERNGAKLTLYNKAASDHCGTATFYASAENDPTASLKPEGKKQIALEVPVVTLDSLVPEQPIFLIKIDVEGCECEVLAGAKSVLDRARFLIIEAHTEEALAKIKDALGPQWNSRQVGASDYLFARIKN